MVSDFEKIQKDVLFIVEHSNDVKKFNPYTSDIDIEWTNEEINDFTNRIYNIYLRSKHGRQSDEDS